MVNILSWNCRGLGKSKRRRLLKEYLADNKIDLNGVQENKLDNLPLRTLNFLSTSISKWILNPPLPTLKGLWLVLVKIFFSNIRYSYSRLLYYCSSKI